MVTRVLEVNRKGLSVCSMREGEGCEGAYTFVCRSMFLL